MIRYTDEGMYYGTRYCEMKTNVWGCDSGDMTLRPLNPVSLERIHITAQYPIINIIICIHYLACLGILEDISGTRLIAAAAESHRHS